MIEKKLISLIFGDVVVASTLTGIDVKSFGDSGFIKFTNGKYSWSNANNSDLTIQAPLRELRELLVGTSPAMIESLARAILKDSDRALEQSYPGGKEQAIADLADWLQGKDTKNSALKEEERTAFIFGGLAIVPTLPESTIHRIYGELDSYCVDQQMEIYFKYPLEEIRDKYRREEKSDEDIMEACSWILKDPYVEETYPGGQDVAVKELFAWMKQG